MRFISRYFSPTAWRTTSALMAVDEGEVIFAICSRGHGQSSIREEDNPELKVEAYRVLTRWETVN